VKNDFLVVGRIKKCFGLKGEVFVEPMTYSNERFKDLNKVFIGFNSDEVIETSVSSTTIRTNSVVLKFDTFNTRSEIENYIGSFIFVDSSNKIKLPEDKYFIHDLIGLTVEDNNGNPLGIINDVLILPANNVFVVEYNGKEVLIPDIKEFIKKVDLEEKKIVIDVIEGLFEI
jgi:16S rRNA processing protein RimM